MTTGPLPPPSAAAVHPKTGRDGASSKRTEGRDTGAVVWRAPEHLASPPGSEAVLPQLDAPGVRIECLSRRPLHDLADRMRACRERQEKVGFSLASTFCHGSSLFLVFKRWRNSASEFPRST